jgi:Tol biopolymer transport system component
MLLSALALITLLASGAGLTTLAARQPAAQAPGDADWRAAVDAWEAGRYPDALTRLTTLLKSPAAAAYAERVALLTGEWYPSVAVAMDGRNPRLSPDGRFVTYETGPTAAPVTRVVRADANGALVAEVPGASAQINAAGTHLLYLRPPQTPEWTAAQGNALQANWLLATGGSIVIRDLATGAERVANTGAILKANPVFASDGREALFVGAEDADLTRSDIYLTTATGPRRLTNEPGFKTLTAVDPSGKALLYTTGAILFRRPPTPGAEPPAGAGRAGGAGAGRGGGQGGATAAFSVVDVATGATRTINGLTPTMSANGATIAWISRTADAYTLTTSPTLADTPTIVRTGRERLDAPALSPDGTAVAYQLMQFTDWEIFVSRGTTHQRVTRDIQHDVLPRFLTNTTLIGMMGEPRHRRSQIYDLTTGTRRRLLHNNTIRTVVPEYAWLPSADGTRVLTVADYDGDTISTERSLHLTDLTRTVSVPDVITRLERQLSVETELRARTTRMFEPIAADVRTVLGQASVARVFEHAKRLYEFDSKHVTQPGNAKAIEYLTNAYRSFGYDPVQQWFPNQQALGGRTANVLATLKGTVNPELIYIISSHFDSVAIGPGADDDTSGTTALLEAARILARTPLPATVVFASFTGEESGLLGSREFVRQANEAKWQVAGALNNDMIGWAGEGPQLNNTIRYSNGGIRDLQHAASFLFTDIVLFDTKYYRGTDAGAFYEAWGDIVGGIGSYPILANPNYHQPTDYLDTINQHQVTETAKVTAATIMYLASSPSRLKNVTAAASGANTRVTWTPSPESGIRHYLVAYGPANDPRRTQITVTAPEATLPALPAGTSVSVKAVNSRGLEGWDWAVSIVK